MRPYRLIAAHAAASLLLVACGNDTPTPTSPATMPAFKATFKPIQMMDACDPETFNAAVGPGTCLRNGGVRFPRFLQLLGQHHALGAWHFAPSTVNARVGQTLRAVNHGGEVHTFTEVEEFGGGIVPDLNTLAGTPDPAPECLTLPLSDFVPPGGTYTDEVEEAGVERYQCCIHPWMRAVVTARE
jgi:plastocyanin